MADARDLKSRGHNSPCGFDSRLGYLASAVVRNVQECSEALEKGLLNASRLDAEMRTMGRRAAFRSGQQRPRTLKV